MAEDLGIPRNRYFHHHCMLVVMDCMSSAVSPKGSLNTQLIEKERFDKYNTKTSSPKPRPLTRSAYTCIRHARNFGEILPIPACSTRWSARSRE